MLNGIIGVVTICYPFLVWFAHDSLQPRYLALALAALFLLRFLIRPLGGVGGALFPLLALFMLVVAFINQTEWLLVYPAMISLTFFVVFAGSLWFTPPVVERLARLEDPDLPPKGVAYTRKVTQVWSGFFLLNAAISLLTVWYGDDWLWSVYNGGVFYLLMGLLMGVEMLIRRRVKASY